MSGEPNQLTWVVFRIGMAIMISLFLLSPDSLLEVDMGLVPGGLTSLEPVVDGREFRELP